MSKKPLVSVLFSVYNGERFLKQTIDSVLSQTYDNLEIIVVDDVSTDASKEIIDSYEDNRIIKVYKEKNENVCGAMNIAFAMAKGKYCAIIGHDDVWEVDKIERQVAYMEENEGCGVCFTRCNIIDQNSQVINEEDNHFRIFNMYKNGDKYYHLQELYCKGNRLCAPSAMIRTSVLREVGAYDYALLQLQDYELWLRVLTIAEIYILEEQLTNYRRILDAQSNISTINDKTILRGDHEMTYIRYKFLYYMSDEIFTRIMSVAFKKKGTLTKEELMCERMFILQSMENPYWTKVCAELLNDEKYRSILENEYHFTLQDFYKCNETVIFKEQMARTQTKYKKKPLATDSFLAYMNAFISTNQMDLAINFLVEMGDSVDANEVTDILCVLFEIYSREMELKEPSIFLGRASISAAVACYKTLQTLIVNLNTNQEETVTAFANYVIENQISSSAILFAIDRANIPKIITINNAAMALMQHNQQLHAIRLLKCAYENSKDDMTIFNLAFVLYCCGSYESAAQVLQQIKIENDVVQELRQRIYDFFK